MISYRASTPRRSSVVWLFGLSIAVLIAGAAIYYCHIKDDDRIVYTLDNTPFQKTYLIKNPEAKKATVYFIIQAGEADNTSTHGMAHYVEHLSWLNANGTKPSPKDATHSNASTTEDYTDYWLSGPTDQLPALLSRLSKVLQPITIPDDFANQEQQIIQREYDMRVADNVIAKTQDQLNASLYEGTGLARSVMGTRENINAFTYADAKALHKISHRPEKTIVIVTGNVTPDAVRAALPKNLPALQDEKPVNPVTLNFKATGRTVVQVSSKDDQETLIWRKIVTLPEAVDYDTLELQLTHLYEMLDTKLDTKLDGGLAGPLRYDNFIARTYDIGFDVLDESHVEMQFFARPDTGISLQTLLDKFEEALAGSAQKGIPQKTYERINARFDDYWPDMDDPKEIANWMSDYIIERARERRAPLPLDRIKALDKTIDRASLNGLLRTIAGPGITRIAIINHQEKTK